LYGIKKPKYLNYKGFEISIYHHDQSYVLNGCNLKNTNSLYFLKKKLNNFLTTPYFP